MVDMVALIDLAESLLWEATLELEAGNVAEAKRLMFIVYKILDALVTGRKDELYKVRELFKAADVDAKRALCGVARRLKDVLEKLERQHSMEPNPFIEKRLWKVCKGVM